MTGKSVLGTMLVVFAQFGLQMRFQRFELSWAQFSHSGVATAVDQGNSRLTEIPLAVDNGGLFILKSNAECLRDMRHNSLGLL